MHAPTDVFVRTTCVPCAWHARSHALITSHAHRCTRRCFPDRTSAAPSVPPLAWGKSIRRYGTGATAPTTRATVAAAVVAASAAAALATARRLVLTAAVAR